MADANKKEENDVVVKVGSGSTWGTKERERFNIPSQGVEMDAVQLIGREWFDVKSFVQSDWQRQSMFFKYKNALIDIEYEMLRNTLKMGTQEDYLEPETPMHLEDEIRWKSFRREFLYIYRSGKTGVGARHDTTIAKRKKSGRQPVGRKEESKPNQTEPGKLPSAPSGENTQVSRLSNFALTRGLNANCSNFVRNSELFHPRNASNVAEFDYK